MAQTEITLLEASVLGTIAFNEGRKAVPCHDAKLMDLLRGLPVGDEALGLLKAWTHSWHAANLAQTVTM